MTVSPPALPCSSPIVLPGLKQHCDLVHTVPMLLTLRLARAVADNWNAELLESCGAAYLYPVRTSVHETPPIRGADRGASSVGGSGAKERQNPRQRLLTGVIG